MRENKHTIVSGTQKSKMALTPQASSIEEGVIGKCWPVV